MRGIAMRARRAVLAGAVTGLGLVAGCGGGAGAVQDVGAARGSEGGADGETCRVVQRPRPLPDGLGEASGAAWSPARPDVFWSHNDSGGEPELFLVTTRGTLAGRVRLPGAQMADWEDIAVTPCEVGRCLVVGDVGDHGRAPRDPIVLYTLAEPAPEAPAAGPVQAHRATFPDGRVRDVEALLALPDGRIYLITKGNEDPVELYRWPTPLREEAVLERVRELASKPEQPGDRVTGAAASPNGRYVAVRTYSMLALYRTPELLGSGAPAMRMDLTLLGESQGEGVALADDGRVLLVSESGSRHVPGSMALLQCPLP